MMNKGRKSCFACSVPYAELGAPVMSFQRFGQSYRCWAGEILRWTRGWCRACWGWCFLGYVVRFSVVAGAVFLALWAWFPRWFFGDRRR
jgi:hypothetical protein